VGASHTLELLTVLAAVHHLGEMQDELHMTWPALLTTRVAAGLHGAEASFRMTAICGRNVA